MKLFCLYSKKEIRKVGGKLVENLVKNREIKSGGLKIEFEVS